MNVVHATALTIKDGISRGLCATGPVKDLLKFEQFLSDK
jgi:hypothetical protein